MLVRCTGVTPSTLVLLTIVKLVVGLVSKLILVISIRLVLVILILLPLLITPTIRKIAIVIDAVIESTYVFFLPFHRNPPGILLSLSMR